MAEHTGWEIEKLFDYVTRVLDRLYPGLRHRHDVFEDLRQECIVDLLTAMPKYDPGKSNPRTWQYHRIRSTACHFFRSLKRLEEREVPLMEAARAINLVDPIVLSNSQLDKLITLGEPGYVYYLYACEGYTIPELARLMHVGYHGIARRLKTIRTRLRQLYG